MTLVWLFAVVALVLVVVVGLLQLPRPQRLRAPPTLPALPKPQPTSSGTTVSCAGHADERNDFSRVGERVRCGDEMVVRATDALTVRERLPIVLVHGFGGWDEIRIGPRSHAYFRGVRERLAAAGLDVRTVRLPPAASISERAHALARQLDLERKVHLVAHSMGGVDARFALARLGAGARVATLVSIGSPHRGTPIAELASRLARKRGWRSLTESLEDLSTQKMLALDEQLIDVVGVRYASFVVRPRAGARGVSAPLVPTYLWLERTAGASDGVVPARSQARGLVLGELDTDHWGAIGWAPLALSTNWTRGPTTKFDAPSFYEKLALHLANDEPLDRFAV